MYNLVNILTGDRAIEPDEARAVFEVLEPIITKTADSEAIDAAKSVLERLEPEGLLPALLDWWFVVTTGHSTVNGLAFRVHELLPDQVGASLDALLKVHASVPPAAWMRARRSYDESLGMLDDQLDLEHHGSVKMPGEREAWSELCEWLEPTIGALKAGEVPEPFALEVGAFEKALKAGGVIVNTPRFKETVGRARQLVDFVNGVVALAAIVEPAVSRPGVGPVRRSDVSEQVIEVVGERWTTLLEPVLEDGPDDDPVQTMVEMESRLEAAASGTDLHGQRVLAAIADDWITASGARVPSLEPVIAERRAVEGRVEALRRQGVDTVEAEVALLDHEFEEANRILDDLHADAELGKRRETLERRRDLMSTRLGEVGEAGSSLTDRIYEVDVALASAELERAASLLGELDREITSMQDEATVEESRRLLDELDFLDEVESVRFDLLARLEEVEASDDTRAARDLTQELQARVAVLRDQRHEETQQRLDVAMQVLEDHREEFARDDLAELELEAEEVEQRLRDGELMAARERSIELERDIAARRVHRWTADQGEDELVRHLIAYCTGDIDFDESDIRRLHVALKTKPFVILAGLTGSGKSTVARLYAEALGATPTNGQFRRIAVRPDWIDQSEVLGYVNPTSNRFEPGWLAETVRACEREPDRLFFVVLDEMNLAPVEQYLAEVLSAMEEARAGAGDVRLRLYPRGMELANAGEWNAEVRYPSNLVLIGTVNVDETTRPLSERVIDRANVLQLQLGVSDRHHREPGPAPQPWLVAFAEWRRICSLHPDDRHHEFLADVADALRRAGIGVGMRAHVELERFIGNADEVLDDEDALDWALIQRIIPKVRGFKRDLAEALAEFEEMCRNVGATRTSTILQRWLEGRVSDDDFLDGTDARVALAYG